MDGTCRICGQIGCKKHSFLFENIKRISEFSGSSPPEIFVGKWNYPNDHIGILSPKEKGDTTLLSSQELWHEQKLTIPQIINLRSKLIYGRNQSNIRKVLSPEIKSKFITTMQEVAMTSKSISLEFKLEKGIQRNLENDSHTPIINNAAQVKSVALEENPIVNKKVDQLATDTDALSTTAILELEKSNIPTATIIKILSAGLIGKGIGRKLVPTRWAITAVDDTLSKTKLKKIKYFQEINEILLFNAEYLGNHYEFLLLPQQFSFEVIEINATSLDSWHDYETFFGRKNYASSVTGAYYANRLALCEYLERVNRQCTCIVFREISPEYTQSMGVGVLRQISREAFSKQPEKFATLEEALLKISSRIKLPLEKFKDKSEILKMYKKQSKLNSWFS
jgi:hypothetical protein